MIGPHLNCLIAASANMLMLLAAPAFAEDEVEFLNGSKIKGTIKEIRKDKKVQGEGFEVTKKSVVFRITERC